MILETLSQCSFVPDSICAAATEVLTHIISNTLTVIASAGIAFVGYIFYTTYNRIRKKTRLQSKQKLELDSIIKVIDGTEKLKSAMNELHAQIAALAGAFLAAVTRDPLAGLDRLEGMADMIEKGEKAPSELVMWLTVILRKSTQASSEKIENFIFLLKRDMILNGEDEAVRTEIKNIEKIYKKLSNIFYDKKAKPPRTMRDLRQYARIIWNNVRDVKIDKKLDESIEIILTIYTAKLN